MLTPAMSDCDIAHNGLPHIDPDRHLSRLYPGYFFLFAAVHVHVFTQQNVRKQMDESQVVMNSLCTFAVLFPSYIN